jgi:hypothetical protein
MFALLLLFLVGLQNPAITPGDLLDVPMQKICIVGYARKTRNVSYATKLKVMERYGLKYDPDLYQIDHLIPLQLGGSNDIENLWPQKYQTPYGAWHKDRLENLLHNKVCRGELKLVDAQQIFRENWIAGYKMFLGNHQWKHTSLK